MLDEKVALISKNDPKIIHGSFLSTLNGHFSKWNKVLPNTWATLVRKYVTKTFEKYSNQWPILKSIYARKLRL